MRNKNKISVKNNTLETNKISLEVTEEELKKIIHALGLPVYNTESTKKVQKLISYLKSKKPINLTYDTEQLLRLVADDFKYIGRDEYGQVFVFDSEPDEDCNLWETESSKAFSQKLNEEVFKSDLSFLEEDGPIYLIEELLDRN